MMQARESQAKTLAVLATNASGLVGSGLGSGKTFVGTEHIRSLKDRPPRVLVVAPIITHGHWENTMRSQYPSLAEHGLVYRASTPKATPEIWALMEAKAPGVFIIGWEAMRGDLPLSVRKSHSRSNKKQPPITAAAIKEATESGLIPPWGKTGTWSLVIADEVHRIANRGSLAKKVLASIKTRRKLALSGTAAGNKPEGIWSVLNWLWPSLYRSFWRWAEDCMVITERQINRNGDTVKVIVGEKRPGSTWGNIPCVVRYRTEDICGELPEVIERIVEVPMSDQQRRIYDDFERDAISWMRTQQGENRLVVAEYPIDKRIRMRTAALGDVLIKEFREEDGKPVIGFNEHGSHYKILSVKEIIGDLPENDPVIVYTHSAQWAHLAAMKLEEAKIGEVRAYTGDLSAKQGEALRAAFGKNIRVLVAVIAAVAEGTDGLQHVCRNEIWASKTESNLLNEQAEGRLHRPGQTSPVQRWLLHSEDSVDTDMEARLAMLRERMRQFYGDDKEGR